MQQSLPFPLRRYGIDESMARQEHLESLWDLKAKQPIRSLTEDEEEFILNEIVLSTYDFRYWVPRYAFLNTKLGELKRMEFWESQQIALDYIADGEFKAWKSGGSNLWDWLKARQLGATELAEKILGHRLFFYENQRAVIASDEPDHSLELSRRIELMYDRLPWWMKPHRKFHVKGTEMYFDHLNCSLVVGHGRKEGGGLGQGQSTNVFHFTELPDWENFNMIEEDFLPTVPIHPTSTGFMESTARGRNDQWHQHFKEAWGGRSRFSALFIPWYAEQHTYTLRPPEDWKPGPETVAHARIVEHQSPKYCHGRTMRLTEGQMYFWEFTRAEYERKGKLHVFLQEYASDHLSAFQNLNVGMFRPELLATLRDLVKPFSAYDVINNAEFPMGLRQ